MPKQHPKQICSKLNVHSNVENYKMLEEIVEKQQGVKLQNRKMGELQNFGQKFVVLRSERVTTSQGRKLQKRKMSES